MGELNVASLYQESFRKYKENWLAGILVTLAYAVLYIIPVVGQFVAPLVAAALFHYGLLVWSGKTQLSVQEPFSLPGSTYLKVGIVFIGLALLQLVIMKAYSSFVSAAYTHGLWFSFSFYSPYLSGMVIGLLAYFFLFSYSFLILEKNAELADAIKISFSLSLNNSGNLIIFVLVAWVINLVGALPCGVGLLVTAPTTLIASAGLYKKLVGEGSA
ncbi:MAG: hypothetical protein NZ580_03735 [Bacteroidia bacterium]|nr:hypothetical protein [Bacteroidia bacterium]MDW8235440.1 hypothetical protein [Bacteroidia bacterium]